MCILTKFSIKKKVDEKSRTKKLSIITPKSNFSDIRRGSERPYK